MNETVKKFGYPDSLIHEYNHWVVLVRPKQVTLGSVILAAKPDATSWPDLPAEAFVELREVTGQLEKVLQGGLGCERINYLMLMMVDPHVHFHVLPRYSRPQKFGDLEVLDVGWPKPPNLNAVAAFTPEQLTQLRDHLRGLWPA